MMGLAHYLPKNRVTARALDQRLALTPGSVEKKSGLKVRHFANQEETASTMGAIAAKRALSDANLKLTDIDAIIGASGVPEQALPCTAALIQKKLGLQHSGIPCFDINTTCLSFLTAVETAAYLIEGGRFKRVLIVSSDLPSKGLDWTDLETCTIFGDGAAACVLGKSHDDSKILATHLETHSVGTDMCKLEVGGSRLLTLPHNETSKARYFQMDGKRVFKLASQLIEQSTDTLFAQTNLSLTDMDWVIPHQASKLAMHHMRKKLNIPLERFGDVYDTIGNQMAASIPTAMCLLREQNKLKRGQKLCLLGSGAGLAVAGIIMVF